MSNEPEVILVDYLDRPIGAMKKSAAHAGPHLHRAFSVFLYHGDSILLQRRALDKYHCGGLWTNSCCSHPRPGEELLEAAGRRLEEELGVHGVELRELSAFSYFYRFPNGVCEYECDHVLLGEYDGDCVTDPGEVAEIAWVGREELLKTVEEAPERFTPWFLICLRDVLRRLP